MLPRRSDTGIVRYITTIAAELSLLFLALCTRIWQLGYHSIWFDEAVSLRWAGSDPAYTWRVTFELIEDKHPPAYYLALHLWQRALALGGLDRVDAALRVSGSLFGVLTVAGLMVLVRRVGSRRTSLLAGLFAAFSPILVWYSQELRMFQPATTGILWACAFLAIALNLKAGTRRWLTWLGLVISLEFALYAYLFSAFVFPALGLTLLAVFLYDRDLRRFMEGCAALFLSAALYLPLARNAWQVNAAESTPGHIFADFWANLGRLVQTHTIWRLPWDPTIQTMVILFFSAAILSGLLLPDRADSSCDSSTGPSLSWWQQPPGERLWLWIWLGVPLVIANLLLSRSGSIFVQDRYLLFVGPFLLWAAARGIVALFALWRPAGFAAGATATVLLVAALPPLWTPQHQRENWRDAAHYVAAYEQHSDGLRAAVISHIDYTHIALEWYLRQNFSFDELPIFFPFGGQLAPADEESTVAPPLRGLVDFGAQTVWLTQSHLDGVDDQRVVEGWLSRNFPVITELFPAGMKLSGYMLQYRFEEMPQLGAGASWTDAELARDLRLVACELITPQVKAIDEDLHPPSGWVHVRLWWEPTAPLAKDYIATAQVVGPEGVWGERLHRPTDTLRFYPTSQWLPGEYVRDEVDINLNPLTPPGEYPVIIGATDELPNTAGPTVECGRVSVY